MHIEDVPRTLRDRFERRDPNRGTVRRQHRVAWAELIQLRAHLPFDLQLLRHILDDSIHCGNGFWQMCRALDTAQNALLLVHRDVLPRQPACQFLGMALGCPLQRRRRTTEELDRIPMDGTVQGNLRAHCASADDANRVKGSCSH